MEWMLVTIAIVVALAACAVAVTAARARNRGADLVGTAIADRRLPTGATPAGGRPGAASTGGVPPERAATDVPPDAVLLGEIQALMRQQRKIQAIKLLRTRVPMSLAEAKRLVEEIDAGQPPRHWPGQPQVSDLGGPLVERATALKRQGRPIDAIKLVRSETGLPLREAKEVVDRL